MAGVEALNLTERRAALAAGALAHPVAPAAMDEAADLLEWWKETYLAGSKRLMTRRLRAVGLDQSTVLPLLASRFWILDFGFWIDGQGKTIDQGSPTDDQPSITDRPQSKIQNPKSKIPHWQTVLAEILSGWRADGTPASDVGSVGFEVAIQPFVRWAQSRLEAQLAELPDADPGLRLDADALTGPFAAWLGGRLKGQAIRTLVLRMHAAKLLGRLRADTPEARFEEFVREELSDAERFAVLLAEYPVLGRVLATTTEHAVMAWGEALTRLVEDWGAIRATFTRPDSPETLAALETGLGDSHRNGRSVMKLRFASGWRLVYKPKPLAVDVHFQELIAWLNDRGLEPALRTVAVLDRGDYGWMEFVEAGPCEERAQVEAFYRRQGALLLVVYLLHATDFHLENVIAAAEHPVAIDLEMVFCNRPRLPRGGPGAELAAEEFVDRLVMATGLLPMRVVGPAGSEEISGLAGEGGHKSAFVAPRWTDEGTDQMRLVPGQPEMRSSENVPRLGDQPARVADYGEFLIQGFADAYRRVLAHREALAAPGGPLEAFQPDEVRHILRATRVYGLLLADSQHPSCLRDAVERDFLFDSLWGDVTTRPYLARMVPSEQEDLWNGDIPVFNTRVGGRDLFDSRGRRFRSYFAQSGLERVRERLSQFSEDDLARQLYCVRGSLAAVVQPGGEAASQLTTSAPPPSTAATLAALVAAATRIGDRLAQLAVCERGEAVWIGPELLPDGHWVFASLRTDLYSGAAGIALFLAQLARATGQARFDDLARAAYRCVRRQLRERDPEEGIGAFVGVPSMLYAALHLAAVWEEPEALTDLLGALRVVKGMVRRDSNLDIVAGVAGCLTVMLRLHRRHPEAGALEIARACGEHLLRHAMPVSTGRAWPPAFGAQPGLGLSHGAAGICWALFELATVTGDARFRAAAAGGLAYERAHFDSAKGNWPDSRDRARVRTGEDENDSFSWLWCHGAPGIGIARLMSRPHTDDPEIDAEIAAALRSTAERGFGGTHCLCHGDLGNADLFLLAAAELQDELWRGYARRRAQGVLETEAREGRWRCGNPGFAEMPGLMVGLAGIGYGLLRMADPVGVPSVLALQGPRGPGGEAAKEHQS